MVFPILIHPSQSANRIKSDGPNPNCNKREDFFSCCGMIVSHGLAPIVVSIILSNILISSSRQYVQQWIAKSLITEVAAKDGRQLSCHLNSVYENICNELVEYGKRVRQLNHRLHVVDPFETVGIG